MRLGTLICICMTVGFAIGAMAQQTIEIHQWRGTTAVTRQPEQVLAGTMAEWRSLWSRVGAPAPDHFEPGRMSAVGIFLGLRAGTGYFAVRFARMLPQGKIYAADIEPDMVRHLAQRAKREQLANVFAIQSATDDARLPEKVDLALFVDTYHHIDDRSRYFARLKGTLAPQGRVAIVDFTMDSEIGPPPRARVTPEQVKRELAKAGYELAGEHDFLPNQYFLVFRPN